MQIPGIIHSKNYKAINTIFIIVTALNAVLLLKGNFHKKL